MTKKSTTTDRARTATLDDAKSLIARGLDASLVFTYLAVRLHLDELAGLLNALYSSGTATTLALLVTLRDRARRAVMSTGRDVRVVTARAEVKKIAEKAKGMHAIILDEVAKTEKDAA